MSQISQIVNSASIKLTTAKRPPELHKMLDDRELQPNGIPNVALKPASQENT